MSFNTTASNTGAERVECVFLGKQIGRNFLYFAYRHHVHKLIIASFFFFTLSGPSKSLNIQKLIQTVENHRKWVPDARKSALLGYKLCKKEYGWITIDLYQDCSHLCTLSTNITFIGIRLFPCNCFASKKKISTFDIFRLFEPPVNSFQLVLIWCKKLCCFWNTLRNYA